MKGQLSLEFICVRMKGDTRALASQEPFCAQRKERRIMSVAPAAAGGCSLLVSFRSEESSWERPTRSAKIITFSCSRLLLVGFCLSGFGSHEICKRKMQSEKKLRRRESSVVAMELKRRGNRTLKNTGGWFENMASANFSILHGAEEVNCRGGNGTERTQYIYTCRHHFIARLDFQFRQPLSASQLFALASCTRVKHYFSLFPFKARFQCLGPRRPEQINTAFYLSFFWGDEDHVPSDLAPLFLVRAARAAYGITMTIAALMTPHRLAMILNEIGVVSDSKGDRYTWVVWMRNSSSFFYSML